MVGLLGTTGFGTSGIELQTCFHDISVVCSPLQSGGTIGSSQLTLAAKGSESSIAGTVQSVMCPSGSAFQSFDNRIAAAIDGLFPTCGVPFLSCNSTTVRCSAGTRTL
jgi:hypothetical protein